jgi:hypothetical protein
MLSFKIDKIWQNICKIVPENVYGIVSPARWIILGTRLKARERFRRLVPIITHLALKALRYAYKHQEINGIVV